MQDLSGKDLNSDEALETKDIYQILNNTFEKVTFLSNSSKNIEAELRQMHKLYHNEFRTMLDGMEKELKHYRNVNEGKIFDGILSELSKLYAENIELLNEISDGDAKTRFGYLFEDILQILESHGVSVHKSKVKEPSTCWLKCAAHKSSA